MLTASPTVKPSTLGPMASTSPEASHPMPEGSPREVAAAEHGIRSVQPEGPGADADLSRSGVTDLDVVEGQDLGTTGGMEADDLAHESGVAFQVVLRFRSGWI
jgi:hypothetical protein